MGDEKFSEIRKIRTDESIEYIKHVEVSLVDGLSKKKEFYQEIEGFRVMGDPYSMFVGKGVKQGSFAIIFGITVEEESILDIEFVDGKHSIDENTYYKKVSASNFIEMDYYGSPNNEAYGEPIKKLFKYIKDNDLRILNHPIEIFVRDFRNELNEEKYITTFKIEVAKKEE